MSVAFSATAAWAQNNCGSLPAYSALQGALASALAAENSGLNNQMWATLVDRDGVVCAVVFSGVNRGAQWPGSRVISAQKANTANAFSLDSSSSSAGKGQASGLALSTANLYSAVQPGGSLFGLQASNPVNADVAYQGQSYNYGQASDPIVGSKIGGVNVFGGAAGEDPLALALRAPRGRRALPRPERDRVRHRGPLRSHQGRECSSRAR